MTIKQNGGVFGRNPSFNDVEANDLIAGNVEIPQGGKLYIGNGSPGGSPRGDLEIYHNGSNSYIDEVYAGNLLIRGHSRIQFQGYVSGKNFIIMDDGGAVSLWHNGANKLQTTSTGIGVTGNVALTDGGGIDFSATAGTGTSELFDDYEEGTWTPVLQTSGGAAIAQTSTGLYRKVGSQVTIWFTCAASEDLGTPNYYLLTNIPFTCSGLNQSTTVGMASSATNAGNANQRSAFTVSGADNGLRFWVRVSTDYNFSNSDRIEGFAVYTAA